MLKPRTVEWIKADSLIAEARSLLHTPMQQSEVEAMRQAIGGKLITALDALGFDTSKIKR